MSLEEDIRLIVEQVLAKLNSPEISQDAPDDVSERVKESLKKREESLLRIMMES